MFIGRADLAGGPWRQLMQPMLPSSSLVGAPQQHAVSQAMNGFAAGEYLYTVKQVLCLKPPSVMPLKNRFWLIATANYWVAVTEDVTILLGIGMPSQFDQLKACDAE